MGDGGMIEDDEEDFPPIHYPHPITGYEWELEHWRRPVARGGDVSAKLLLDIAKEAYKIKEIRENLMAELKYWTQYGVRDEDGFPVNAPVLGMTMLNNYYAHYVVDHNIIDQYTRYGASDLTKLLNKWVMGEALIDDDANSIIILDETKNWGKDDA
jgi:hypothetical protein